MRENYEVTSRVTLSRFSNYFKAISLVVMVIAAVAIGLIYRSVVTDNLTQYAKDNSVALSIVLSNNLTENIKDIVARSSQIPDSDLLNEVVHQRFERQIEKLIEQAPILKIKIYDLKGRIVFSTDPADYGKKEDGENYLGALNGKIGAELTTKDFHLNSERDDHTHYVETYYPLYLEDSDRVSTVFEIYYDVTEAFDRMQTMTTTFIFVVFGIFAVLYAILNAFMVPANKAVRWQIEENHRLASALRKTPDGIFIADATALDYPVVFVNPAFEDLTGLEVSQTVDKKLKDILPPQIEGGDQFINELLQNGQISAEWMSPSKGDGETWLHLKMNTTHGGKNNISYIVGRISDVTERRRIQERNALLAMAIEKSVDEIEITDGDSRIIYVNPAFEKGTGYSLDDAIGKMPSQFLRPIDADVTFYEEIAKTLSQGRTWQGEYPARTKSGDLREQEVSITPVQNERGEMTNVIAVKRDVTQTHKIDETLLKLSRAVEQSASMVVITDHEGTIEYVNPSFSEVTGIPAEEALGQNPKMFQSGETDLETYNALWNNILSGEIWEGEILNRRKNGELYWEHQTISPIRGRDGEISHYVAIKEDITERREAENHIKHMAMHDNLTDLANRFYFREQLNRSIAQALRGGPQGAVLFIDLDNFKEVNDTLGHQAGDEVLKQVGKRLMTTVRDDDLVARLGGDEFALIVSYKKDPMEVAELSERVIRIVSEPYYLDEGDVVIGASVGITLFPTDSVKPDQLLLNADLALYKSKNNEKGCYHFYEPEMDEEILEQKILSQDLRHALGNNELELYYQPVIDISTGEVKMIEALLRWNHLRRGMISPVDFIPLAEKIGVIVPIGEWVLYEACAQIRKWMDEGVTNIVPVAVNLSPLQFKHVDLVELVTTVLEKTNIEPRYLHLEVTESIAMENATDVQRALKRLQEIGVEISLDDFGTGYSNLSYLNKLPINRLKIDKSFLKEINEADGDTTIIEAMFSLGQSLSMNVTIEGVEEESQVNFLRDLGCKDLQGFYFSTPLTAGDLEHFLRNKSPRVKIYSK